MLKRLIYGTLLLAACAGCSKEPFPAGRLQQPKGTFSYITPEGWFRSRLAGLDYIIVSTDSDFGIKPNIFIEEILETSEISTIIAQMDQKNSEHLPGFTIENQTDFTTQSGLPGIKVQACHQTKQNLPIATFRYFIQDADRVISITATCAEPVKSKYEPTFDAAIKSLRSETGK